MAFRHRSGSLGTLRSERLIWVGVAALATGCGSSPPSPDGGLRFDVPTAPGAVYTTGDSLAISVDSPMGAMTLNMDSRMTLDLAFARAQEGVQISAQVTDFDASMNNPMTGRISADENDVEGPLVFVLKPNGDVSVDATPSMSGVGEQLRPFQALPYDMFPRLPGRVVPQGQSWVDTVAWNGGPDGGAFASSTVYTYTLAGDTTVAGVSLLKISVAGDTSLEGSMETGGFAIEQSLSGTTAGFYLWDPVASLVHSAELNRDLEGSLRVPSMNLPAMPIRAQGPFKTQIQN